MGPGRASVSRLIFPRLSPSPSLQRRGSSKVLHSPPWFPVSSQLQALIAPLPRAAAFSPGPAQGAASVRRPPPQPTQLCCLSPGTHKSLKGNAQGAVHCHSHHRRHWIHRSVTTLGSPNRPRGWSWAEFRDAGRALLWALLQHCASAQVRPSSPLGWPGPHIPHGLEQCLYMLIARRPGLLSKSLGAHRWVGGVPPAGPGIWGSKQLTMRTALHWGYTGLP